MSPALVIALLMLLGPVHRSYVRWRRHDLDRAYMRGRMEEMESSGPEGRRLAKIFRDSDCTGFRVSPGPRWYEMTLEERYRFSADMLESLEGGSLAAKPLVFNDSNRIEGDRIAVPSFPKDSPP